jgi:hypothetical protein
LQRPHRDMPHPSVCERRSGPSPEQLSAGLHESKELLPSTGRDAKHLFVAAIAAIASCHAKNDVCGNAQVVFAINATVRFCLPLCQNVLCQIPAV